MKRHRWTPDEIAVLRACYPVQPTDELAEQLGLRVEQVYTKAFALKIKKTEAFLSSPAANRLSAETGRTTRFVKGQSAWTKGMKGLQVGGRSAETQFKPGTRNGIAKKRYKPIGTERISRDGYLERKVNDDFPPHKHWRAVHLLLWESAYGALPAGHAVVFKDGNRRNLTLENLELVSRADLMRRNTLHNYGPDVARLYLLKGAITRQINQRERNTK